MVRVKVIFFLVFTSSVYAMTLKGAGKKIEFEKNTIGVQLSKNCNNCEAFKVVSNLTKEKIDTLLLKEKDQRYSTL